MPRQTYRRALGYARVSSKQQALGSSLKDQQEAIAAGARTFGGLKVAPEDMHVEAVSSLREKIETRIQINRLMAKVRKGDLVVVDKVDRWSRDPEFTYASIRQIKERGANVYFVGEGIDASTEDGDTQLSFRILFAREEAKRIKLRMVGTRKKLRDRGRWVEGRPPLGYRLPREGEEKHVLVPVPEEVAVVRRIFKRTIAGKGTSAVSKALGVPMQRVRTVLARARIYLGEQQDTEGNWVKAKHPPIVDRETIDRARLAMQNRRTRADRAGSRTDSWILRDVVVCAHCGGTMSSRYSGRGVGSGSGYRADYYTCYRAGSAYRNHARSRELAAAIPDNRQVRRPMAPPCAHRGAVRVDEVEAEVEPLIKERLVSLREELLAYGSKQPASAPEEDDNAALLVRLAAKRERLTDALGDGTLTKDAYRTAITKLDEEEIRLHERVRKAARPKTLDKKTRLEFLRHVDSLLKVWDRGAPSLRRQAVKELARSVAIAKDRKPSVTWFSLEEMRE